MARGGKRPGAGRPKGSRNKATAQARATLSAKAQQYTDEALNVLYQVATAGESEAARVSAATALLDRGHGKPVQSMEHSGEGGGPIEFTFSIDGARSVDDERP